MAKIMLGLAIVVVGIVCFWLGYHLGKKFKMEANACIYLEKNEEGVDRIRFDLGMEYEDIPKYKQIVFDVKRGL